MTICNGRGGVAIRGLRYQELTMLRKFMIDPLETESTAADEDENAQADQNDGEQYMFPAFEDLGDGRTGGNEFRQQDLPPLPVDLRYTSGEHFVNDKTYCSPGLVPCLMEQHRHYL